jgi:hypothetical protein
MRLYIDALIATSVRFAYRDTIQEFWHIFLLLIQIIYVLVVLNQITRNILRSNCDYYQQIFYCMVKQNPFAPVIDLTPIKSMLAEVTGRAAHIDCVILPVCEPDRSQELI